MPTSLPPLPDEIDDSEEPEESEGDALPPDMPSAIGGGMPPAMEAARLIETGYKMLATAMPSTVPMAAQAISQLRMLLSAPPPADASVPAGPQSPAITGAAGNPAMQLPPPPGEM